MTLNGKWKLYYYPTDSKKINTVEELKSAELNSVEATVPGNVELDLSAAGILPKDLYMGMNILKAEEYESYDWWYETEFVPKSPAEGKKTVLHFGGVDCCAEYFLNGEKFAETENMFMSYDFDVTDKLKFEESNTLHIKIHSSTAKCFDYENELSTSARYWVFPLHYDWLRKAPHSFGWDIMPRAVSAGIWRDVELKYEDIYDFKFIYTRLNRINDDSREIEVCYDTYLPAKYAFKNFRFEIKGTCKESSFSVTRYKKGKFGTFSFTVPNLKLWWPKNYGEPNMYDISIELYCDDELLLTKNIRRGFRIAKLVRTDIVKEDGCFYFEVNGVKIMAVGTNWVPMDAYHSRDAKRYEKALQLAEEANCNIIRCWGGNVYEDHAFFDFCDEHGIMVWQDFAMACAYYPQNPEFLNRIREEAEWLVRNYRDHVSIVLWCGDNEVDGCCVPRGMDPNENKITREVLPDVIKRLDPCRDYIPSSPYVSPEAYKKGTALLPEEHLWGPRDYYKGEYYTCSNAYFVSETGYHGCPAKESIEKFIEPEYVWPCTDNEQWNLHSTDQNNNPARVNLMINQIKVLFGEVPDNLDDFVCASQISQAEAKKLFIERVRGSMDIMGGVIWWNLVDGWPQMSDAVVDYYYNKKLAFDFIKRSSRPFIVMCNEMTPWDYDVITANSTLKTVKGTVKITDLENGKVLFDNEFVSEPNSNTYLGGICTMYSEKGMILIEWKTEEGTFYNTQLYGTPTYSLEKYKLWLENANKAINGK